MEANLRAVTPKPGMAKATVFLMPVHVSKNSSISLLKKPELAPRTRRRGRGREKNGRFSAIILPFDRSRRGSRRQGGLFQRAAMPGVRPAGACNETKGGASSWQDESEGRPKDRPKTSGKSESCIVAKSLRHGGGGTTPGNACGNGGDPEGAKAARVVMNFVKAPCSIL